LDYLRITVTEDSISVGTLPLPRPEGLAAAGFSEPLDRLKSASDPLHPSAIEAARARRRANRPFLQEFGERLAQALFPTPEARDALRASAPAPILLSLPEELQVLPWELLWDTGDFLAESRGLIRVVAGEATFSMPGTPSLLAAMAMPVLDEMGSADSELQPYVADLRGHAAIFRRIAEAQAASVTILRHARRESLSRALERAEHDILYLLAHGHADGIALEDDDWTMDRLDAAAFRRCIRDGGLGLVVLNSCLTAEQTGTMPPLARRLIECGVPAVVGMQFPISAPAADVLCRALVSRLRPGEDLSAILRRARRDVFDRDDEIRRQEREQPAAWEWATPVLFVSEAAVAGDSGLALGVAASVRPLEDPDFEKTQCIRNMPPRFVGRRQELVDVARLLPDNRVTFVAGARGVGKTALAQEAAFRAAADFDRIVWVSARVDKVRPGLVPFVAAIQVEDRPTDEREVLADLAEALGGKVKGGMSPREVEQECVRLAAIGRPLIVLDSLDSVVDTDLIAQLLADLPENARALCTSYPRPEAQRPEVPLADLPTEDAIRLAAAEADRLRIPLEHQDLAKLIRTVGGHPLSIRLAIGGLAQAGQRLGDVLAGIKDRNGDVLEYVLQQELSPKAQRLLGLAAVFPTGVPAAVLRRASGMSHEEFADAAAVLSRAALLEPDPSGDLLKALDLVRLGVLRDLSEGELREAVAAVLRVQESADAELLCGAASELATLCRARGLVPAWLPLGRVALDGARADGTRWRLARAATDLGNALLLTGEPEEALRSCQEAREICEEQDDAANVATALGNMGLIYAAQGKLDEALRCHQEAYDIYVRLRNAEGQATNLGNMGNIYVRQGKLDEALRSYQEAYEIAERLNNPQIMANQRGNMGLIYARQGKLDEALRCHQEAYDIAERLDNPQIMASVLGNMGLIHRRQGKLDEALRSYQEAYDIAERLDNPQIMASALGNMATIHMQRDDPDEALRCCQKAYELAKGLGNPETMANQLGRMGLIHLQQRDLARARENLDRALQLYDQYGFRGPNRDIVEEALEDLADDASDAQ